MKRIVMGLLVVVLMLSATTPAMARRVRVVAGYVPVYPAYRTYATRVVYPRRAYYPVYPVYPVYAAPAPVAVDYYEPAVVVPY
jgi:hypothetical protein